MRATAPFVLTVLLVACDDGATADPLLADAAQPSADALVEPDLDAGSDVDADADGSPDAVVDATPVFRFDAAPPDLGPPDVIRHLWVTVNDIPEAMSGVEPGVVDGAPRSFAWAVPDTGWTLDVHVEDGSAWVPAEMPYLLWRGVSVAQPPYTVAADAVDPPGGVWSVVPTGHRWTGRVVSPLPGGPGRYSIQAVVDGVTTPALQVLRADLTPERDPFPDVDDWYLDFSRDHGSLRVELRDGEYLIDTEGAEPDGVPDFDEAIDALGLLGGDAAWDAEVLRRLREAVRAHLHAFYLLGPDGEVGPDSVRVRFVFAGDAEAPAGDALAGWSRIAVGGEDPEYVPGGRTYFGRAALDWNNQVADDDTGADRGIFTTSFVRFVLANRVTITLLQDYLPAAGGQPFGSLPEDAVYLEPGFDPASLSGAAEIRALRFRFALDTLALALASVLGHEIGHSLGLVKPGLPPEGLLAGVGGPWVEAPVDGAHVDTAGFNLMQSGTSFSLADVANGSPMFNAPNLAYLRRRLVVMP